MDALGFDHPKMLQLLWALPALGALYMWAFAKKRQAMRRFTTVNLLNTLVASVSVVRRRVKAALTLVAAGLLVVAMAGPRWGTRDDPVPLRGIDMVFVLDVSNSMLAEDVAPDRLQRAKLDIKEMLEVLRGDRVGLVVFAGTSTLTCPLTINYGSLGLALEAVDTRSTPRGGTNIGDAVRHAADSLSDQVMDHKAIIVISDGGETDDSYAVGASRSVFEDRGIRVFTVGMGDMTEGARIPLTQGGERAYLEYQGQEVRTKLEPTLLRSMAAAADGAYFSNPDFRVVYDRIRSRVTSRELSTTRKTTRYTRFHWFVSMALLLLTVETLVTDRKAVMR